MADIKSTQDHIKELEKELSTTKYNKKTQGHIGLVKAKIAKLKEKVEARKSSGKKSEGYSVKKTGDGTVVLLGFPSVGKSSLLNTITDAESEVGAYAFTTLTCIPGMLEYKHAKIQVLDVPGVVEGAASGRGRGKEVLQVIRTADLVLMILDIFQPRQHPVLLKEVYDTNVRINKRKPDVRITKKARGGVRIGKTVKTDIEDETIEKIMREFKLNNAEVLIRDRIDIDAFIDMLEGNKVYLPCITIANKTDLATKAQQRAFGKKINVDLFVSAETGLNVDKLKELIFQKMQFMRIYLKEVGKNADMEVPLIMKQGATIGDVCRKLHKDFYNKFKNAKIWGPSVKFDGLLIRKKTHVLKDTDVLELHMR